MSDPDSDLPKLSAPARRALARAGYERLEQLDGVREATIAELHGMGLTRSTSCATPSRREGCRSGRNGAGPGLRAWRSPGQRGA